MYNKVSTDLKFVDREKTIEKFWEDHRIFEKSIEDREVMKLICFMTGRQPPMENHISAMRSDPCYQRYDPEIPYYERL